jgi:ERCC4-related helicase
LVPTTASDLPRVGQLVKVRARQWLVDDVTEPPSPGQQSLVRLSCLDDDAQGEHLDVLWEREVDGEVLDTSSWEKVGRKGFDPPRLFSAYLHTLRWNGVTAAKPSLMQAPFRAGIRVMSFQLEPLRKAILMPRVNLFIADDVGLGKTIEAGLIVREMLMRQKVRRIVVCCPASVVRQWQEELEQRFGLSFVIFDRNFVLERRQERGWGVNPWSTHSRFIISHSLLRNPDYSEPLANFLGDFQPGTLLILDEAHNAAPASGALYAIDSKFTKVVRDLVPRFEHRLFLSATPHNGHSNSFAALLELLDPQRFTRGVPVLPGDLDAAMVRRLKSDLRETVGGLPQRRVIQVDVDGLPPDAPELVLSALLEEYAQLRAGRMSTARASTQAAAKLVTTHLQKRLLSSIEAFARTLKVHRKTLETAEKKATAAAATIAADSRRTWTLPAPPGPDDDEGELPEDQQLEADDARIAAATRAGASAASSPGALLADEERQILDRMSAVAEKARDLPDPRVRKLIAWIHANLITGTQPGSGPRWNSRRLLVFTEFTDTMRYLQRHLQAAFPGNDSRIAVYHGGLGDDTREELKAAFNADPGKHPLRILVATDSAREGVNLQNYCADLFHFDVPWNPGRMEQRNGRIDRQLQREPEVRCHYFFFAQRPEDKVLQTLVKKTERIQEELGSLSKVLEDRLGTMLLGGIRRSEAGTLARKLDDLGPSDAERQAATELNDGLDDTRVRKENLEKQLDHLRSLLEDSKDAVGFSEDAFRDALSCSLELHGAAPLAPVANVDHRPPAFAFPALDKKSGADPTWSTTLDTLRPRRSKDQPDWEWRRQEPRPVVFQSPDHIDDTVVQLHLEHRVARRLLGRFLAQGFVHDDLSRACVGQTKDAIPRVVLLGRLSLFGEGAARLHDEVIAITARWIDPATRKEPLKRYQEVAEVRTLQLLEESFLADSSAAASAHIPAEVQKRLLAGAGRDMKDLVALLEERGEELRKELVKALRERGTVESKAMRDILQKQSRRIEKQIAQYAKPQMSFAFNDDEKQQLAADQRHWQKRLQELKAEIETEPERIKRAFRIKARRLEPVGLVYLWPVTG